MPGLRVGDSVLQLDEVNTVDLIGPQGSRARRQHCITKGKVITVIVMGSTHKVMSTIAYSVTISTGKVNFMVA